VNNPAIIRTKIPPMKLVIIPLMSIKGWEILVFEVLIEAFDLLGSLVGGTNRVAEAVCLTTGVEVVVNTTTSLV